jgi:hypothetical protein
MAAVVFGGVGKRLVDVVEEGHGRGGCSLTGRLRGCGWVGGSALGRVDVDVDVGGCDDDGGDDVGYDDCAGTTCSTDLPLATRTATAGRRDAGGRQVCLRIGTGYKHHASRIWHHGAGYGASDRYPPCVCSHGVPRPSDTVELSLQPTGLQIAPEAGQWPAGGLLPNAGMPSARRRVLPAVTMSGRAGGGRA